VLSVLSPTLSCQAILGMIFIRAEMLEIAEGSSTSAAAPDAEEDA